MPRPQLFAASTTVSCNRGTLSVRKRRVPLVGPDAPEAERSARTAALQATIGEADWLASARHDAVVRLQRVSPSDALIETAYAGRHSMRTAVLAPDQVIVVLKNLASTVHELHLSGLVHGQLCVDHLIVGGSHPLRATLCSPRGVDGDPGDDVSAIVALADQLVTRLAPRSSSMTAAVAELAARSFEGDAELLVMAFESLGRRRLSRWIGFRSPGRCR